MGISKETLTFREQRAILPAKGATDVYFNDTRPNYIAISNPAASSLYMGLNGNTSPNNYDITIPPYATKQWIKPAGTSMITIYNNSDEDIGVTLQSWEGEFDPSAMSQSTEIVGGSTDGLLGIVTIAQMLSGLPEGTNLLGRILIEDFANPLPSGNNMIGRVELENVQPFAIKPTPRNAKKVNVSESTTNIKGGAGVVYALHNLILLDGTSEIWGADYQSENGIKCSNSINVKSVGDQAGYIIFD